MLDENDVFPDSTVVHGRGAVARRLDERHTVAGGTSLRLVRLDDLGEDRVLIQLSLGAVGRGQWDRLSLRLVAVGHRARRPHR